MSEQLLERYNKVLENSENEIISRINKSLAISYSNLAEELRRKYPKIKANDSLIATQRKLLIMAELKDVLNITGDGSNYQRIFEDLLRTSNTEGISLATQLMNLAQSDFVRATAQIPIEQVKYAAEEQTKYLAKYGAAFADNASAIVEQGLIQGWGTPVIERGLLGQLGVTKQKAEMIARTASVSAGNAAAITQYKENGVEGFIWIATSDSRVCPICVTRNGNAYNINDFRPPLHPMCLVGDTEVFGSSVKSTTLRQYSGQVITFHTTLGKKLTVTPNHPILTDKGWVAANLINEGDNFFSCLDRDGVISAIKPDNYQAPSLISEIVGSFRESLGVFSRSVKISPEQFHGDGVGSEVSIVSTNRLLSDKLTTQRFKPFGEPYFSIGHIPTSILSTDSHSALCIPVELFPFRGGMSGLNLISSLFGSHSLPFDLFGLRLVSDMNIGAFQNFSDGRTINRQFLRECVFRLSQLISPDNFIPYFRILLSESLYCFFSTNASLLFPSSEQSFAVQPFQDDSFAQADSPASILGRLSGLVQSDRVVKKVVSNFSGHVYNLETETGWYFANDIITHNCRCYSIPFKKTWLDKGLIDTKWYEDFQVDTLEELEKLGKKPDYGLGAFEKLNGYTEPPKPIWTPKGGWKNQSSQNVVKQDDYQALMDYGREFVGSRKLDEKGMASILSILQRDGSQRAANKASEIPLGEGVPQSAREDVGEFYRLFGRKIKLNGLIRSNSRAYVDVNEGIINVGDNPTRDVIFHELAHLLEANSPALGKAARDWRAYRATGEEKSLNDLVPDKNYGADERAVPDKFVNEYVGKIDPSGHTEVYSIGLQHFSDPKAMKALFDKDPEHFYLMLGTIKSVRQAQQSRSPNRIIL